MDLSRPEIKKCLIFSQKKIFLYFGKCNFLKKKFLYFRRELSELEKLKKNSALNKFSIFLEMKLSSPKIKTFFVFHEGTCKA